MDFGQVREVGWIEGRVWTAHHVTGTAYRTSLDGQTWTEEATVDPTADCVGTTALPQPVPARYL